MALPVGISTCTVNVSPLGDFAGDAHTMKVEWQPVLDGKPSSGVARSIVWAATGVPLVSFPEKIAETGSAVSFAVPHVDQPGFIDGTGGAFTNWAYRVTVTTRDAGRKTYTKTKVIQVFVGQTSVDFDLIPDGTAGTPVTASTQWATRVAIDAEAAARAAADADLQEQIDSGGGASSWGAITGKPATFPPTLPIASSGVTGLDDALTGKVNSSQVYDKATSDGRYATTSQGTKADSAVQPAALTSGLAGKADLVGGVVPTSQIPAIALTSGQVVSNRAALLALTNVQEGDIGVISGTADKGSYILAGLPASSFSNWLLLSAPTDVVQTVNAQTGTVVLGAADVNAVPATRTVNGKALSSNVTIAKADVGLPSVDDTSDANKPVSTAQLAALNQRAVRGLPSYAPSTATGTFDPATGVYNLKESNTRKLRAALTKSVNGGMGEIAVISDSGGAGATSSSTFDRLRSWPLAMRDEWAAQGVPIAGTGLVRMQDGGGYYDSRWSYTGTWIDSTTFRYSPTPGSTATFTTDKVGDRVRFYYTNVGDGSTLTISVNGATSGAGFLQIVQSGAVVQTSATLTVAAPAGSTVSVVSTGYLYGLAANVYTNNGGLLVHNISQSGATASGSGVASWASAGVGELGAVYTNFTVSGSDPDWIWIALGGNDMQGSGTPNATATAAITTIRNRFPNSGVGLVAQQQLNDTLVPAARWESYVGALYALSDTLDVPLVDVRARVGNYAQTVTAGLTTDGQGHFLAPGNVAVGRSIATTADARFGDPAATSSVPAGMTKWLSTLWYESDFRGTSYVSSAPTVGTVYYDLIYVPNAVTIAALGARVSGTNSGAVANFGIYARNSVDGTPSARLFGASIAAPTANPYQVTSSLVVAPGFYFTAFMWTGAGPNIACTGGGAARPGRGDSTLIASPTVGPTAGYQQAGQTSLPATATPTQSTSTDQARPRVALKVA